MNSKDFYLPKSQQALFIIREYAAKNWGIPVDADVDFQNASDVWTSGDVRFRAESSMITIMLSADRGCWGIFVELEIGEHFHRIESLNTITEADLSKAFADAKSEGAVLY